MNYVCVLFLFVQHKTENVESVAFGLLSYTPKLKKKMFFVKMFFVKLLKIHMELLLLKHFLGFILV